MDFTAHVESVCAAANRVPAGCAASRGIHAWACPEAPCGLVALGTGSYVSILPVHAMRVIGTLAGHTGRVNQVAWLSELCSDAAGRFADETELVSCSSDATVRVWRIEHAISLVASAGVSSALLTGHSGPVTSVSALRLRGLAAVIASVSTDCTLRVFFRPEEVNTTDVPAISSWGAAGVHRTRSVGLFEAVTLTVAPGWVLAEAASDLADYGIVIAAGGVDCRIHLFGLRGSIACVCSASTTVEAGSACQVVPLLSVTGHTDWVRHLAFPPSGIEGWEGAGITFLASASKDSKVRGRSTIPFLFVYNPLMDEEV